MNELLESQANGNMTGDSSRLRLEAGEIIAYSPESLVGHAAWLDWPWKLHRIEKNKQGPSRLSVELYNLQNDPLETNNLVGTHTQRAQALHRALDTWLDSVIDSLHGEDY